MGIGERGQTPKPSIRAFSHDQICMCGALITDITSGNGVCTGCGTMYFPTGEISIVGRHCTETIRVVFPDSKKRQETTEKYTWEM